MEDDHSPHRRSRELSSFSPCLDNTTPSPPSTLSSLTSHGLSKLEDIISRHPPILESLLLQLPTSAILALYHVSPYLRDFLKSYPIAWRHLSFRASSPGRLISRQASPASDATGELTVQRSKPYALDQLLLLVIVPLGTRLTSLDLDHTLVSGTALVSSVLPFRRETLQHLSVRSCKKVSLKYHIIPYLTLFSLQSSIPKKNAAPGTAHPRTPGLQHLALKSLYTFRCRHHRRRPYTPGSLSRQDSDAEPTHELIRICKSLGIWTDTAWCPTPAGRCLRRGEFSLGRSAPDARTEVWVVFDRLWRSDNRLGPSSSNRGSNGGRSGPVHRDGRLWETSEFGQAGEPLGCQEAAGKGEGKTTPAHLRHSHRVFVENITCHSCGAQIHERCEHCSVRMHCMGCRKTLCANCAFVRPLPAPAPAPEEKGTDGIYWWAPGQIRSPNVLMQEQLPGVGASFIPPPLKMHSCCLKPQFSNGGGVTYVGEGMTASITNHLRTAPLPMGKGYEDPEFARIRRKAKVEAKTSSHERWCLCHVSQEPATILQWILHGPGSHDKNPCPRNLCQECFETRHWSCVCLVCRERFCFAHDLRGLRMRVCGLKDLHIEKESHDRQVKRETFFAGLYSRQRKIVEGEETPPVPLSGQIMPLDPAATFGKHYDNSRTPQDISQMNSYFTFLEDIRELLSNPAKAHGPVPLSETWTWPKLTPAFCKRIDMLLTNIRSEGKQFGTHGNKLPDRNCAPGAKAVYTSDSLTASTETSPYFWQGCGKFICPRIRLNGDTRPPCGAAVKKCTLCGINVCPPCLAVNPPCDCGYCKGHYRCPRCFPILSHYCTKAAEEKARLAKALKKEREEAIALENVEKAGEFLSVVSQEAAEA